MASTGMSCGRVIVQNDVQADAPSTRAASSVSRGIESSPPISISDRNGPQCHMSVRISQVIAQPELPSQSTWLRNGNSASSTASKIPNSGLRKKRNEVPCSAGDMANGSTSTVRVIE